MYIKKKQKLPRFPAIPLPPSIPRSFSCLVNGNRASGQACIAGPPSTPPPIQTTSCSAVALAAGFSQVRCSTRATTCLILTAVYHDCLPHQRTRRHRGLIKKKKNRVPAKGRIWSATDGGIASNSFYNPNPLV